MTGRPAYHGVCKHGYVRPCPTRWRERPLRLDDPDRLSQLSLLSEIAS